MTVNVEQQQLEAAGFSQPLNLFTLRNAQGMQVTLCDFGASIWSIKVPDREGHIDDVVLNYGDKTTWLSNPYYFGATIGRCANRIDNGKFSLFGQSHQLTQNDGDNHLHGGSEGLNSRFWQGQTKQFDDESCVIFRIESADGDQGYPGNFEAVVRFTLNNNNEVHIEYFAQADADSPINMTNHSYFNLAGEGDILDHQLTLFADHYLPVDDTLIPTGELKAVDGTVMDFRTAKKVGRDLPSLAGGYDHFWVAESRKQQSLRPLARLYHSASGRVMELHSSEPGVQFYSGNFLDGSLQDHKNRPLNRYAGLCLEPHIHPDAVNHSDFPSVILSANQPYQHHSVYRFLTD